MQCISRMKTERSSFFWLCHSISTLVQSFLKISSFHQILACCVGTTLTTSYVLHLESLKRESILNKALDYVPARMAQSSEGPAQHKMPYLNLVNLTWSRCIFLSLSIWVGRNRKIIQARPNRTFILTRSPHLESMSNIWNLLVQFSRPFKVR